MYSIFFGEWFKYLLPIFLTNLFVGFISWPMTSLIFKKLSDRGYSISHLIGWFSIAYIYFVLATFKIFPLSIWSLFFVVFLWICINLFIEFKTGFIRKNFKLLQVAKIQLLFITLLTFWFWIRGHGSTIYQIERFMDYGFLESLFNARTLPLFDFWMVGETVNYYYFSHFLGYVILLLSRISSIPGFFMLVSWVFAISGINAYRFGVDVYGYISDSTSLITKKIAGILTLFLTLFSGPIHSVLWLFGSVRKLFGFSDSVNYWYADATRFIKDTITEMPIYGFSVADTHAHTWGLLVALIVLSILFVMWKTKVNSFFKELKWVFVLSVVLCWAYMINTWDFGTLGILSAMVLFFRYKDWTEKIIYPICVLLLGYVFGFVWKYSIFLPIEGIGIVSESSNIWQWLVVWGGFLFLIIVWLFGPIGKYSGNFKKISQNILHFVSKRKNLFFLIIFLAIIGFWIGQEIFYVKDLLKDGQWYRANTVFKISYQLWIWFGLILGPLIVDKVAKLKWNLGGFLSFFSINIIIILMLAYGYVTILQSFDPRGKYTGIGDGMSWLRDSYPDDYSALIFMYAKRTEWREENQYPVIVEAAGDSFEDNNYFSTYLGWPTIVGWSGHEWTWRGSYDVVGKRRDEVREIYTGDNPQNAYSILDKYKVRYVIVGSAERRIYEEELNLEKLINIGTVIFQTNDTYIIEIKD